MDCFCWRSSVGGYNISEDKYDVKIGNNVDDVLHGDVNSNWPVKVEEDHSNGDDGKAEYDVVLGEPHAKDEEGKTDQQAGATDDRITELIAVKYLLIYQLSTHIHWYLGLKYRDSSIPQVTPIRPAQIYLRKRQTTRAIKCRIHTVFLSRITITDLQSRHPSRSRKVR